MLGKPYIYRPLFVLIAVLTAIAYIPMTALHWVAPHWAELAYAREFVGRLTSAAKEPGHKKPNPYFQPGDAVFEWEPGECWTLGFAKQNLTDSPQVREGIENGRYIVAGYVLNIPSEGIADDLYAKAVWLDDNTGRGGIFYAVVDCIGLSNTDTNKIRAIVWDWARAEDISVRSVQIAATHTHAGIDTTGMWGFPPFDGKDAAFQQLMIEKTARAMIEAYENRQDGQMFLAGAESDDLIRDGRAPYVFDDIITRFRFDPAAEGEADVYLVSAGCHPEIGGSRNPIVSADFPGYMAEYIMEATGAETIFIQGAQGAMITANSERGIDKIRPYGVKFAQYVLGERGSVSEETELPALLNIASAEVEVPIENILFLAVHRVGMINHTAYRVHGKPYRYATACELSYLRLGDRENSVDILIVPGELAPELAMGGFSTEESSARGGEYPRRALFDILQDYPFASERQIVFGLANHFTGYILPDNDYVVHDWLPYVLEGVDRFGKGHYEETNSAGPRTAGVLTKGWQTLLDGVEVEE